jgi:hypothetical protein
MDDASLVRVLNKFGKRGNVADAPTEVSSRGAQRSQGVAETIAVQLRRPIGWIGTGKS